MSSSFKSRMLNLLQKGASVVGKTRVGRVAFEPILASAMARTARISHGGVELSITVPNSLNHFRATTFATKEPETLAWLDGIPKGSVLWDVGANVGLYSCYGAKARGCKVIAFEPSVFNVELLARNIFVNGLTGSVTIFPLPLSDRLGQNTLNMTSTLWGGALSTFGQDYGYDGAVLDKRFEFRTVGLTLDDCLTRLGLPAPDYLKMDVDGIEHLILAGGAEVLSKVKGVSIEINDGFKEQAEISSRLLQGGGLRFVGKAHSQMIEDEEQYKHIFNQVWVR
jgi:FkbM family methyltransferase